MTKKLTKESRDTYCRPRKNNKFKTITVTHAEFIETKQVPTGCTDIKHCPKRGNL
jgi:hypothetical protein